MLPSRWDLVDTREGVRRHPVNEPPVLALDDTENTLARAGVSVVGDDEDSMIGRLVADIEPRRSGEREG